MNPFELPEADFLILYAPIVACGLLLALLLRWLLRSPGVSGGGGGPTPDLTPYEIAYLSGGPDRAVHAALAGLLHRGLMTLGASTGRLYAEEKLPPEAPPLERFLHGLEPGTLANRVVELASGPTQTLADKLVEHGLLLSPSRSTTIRGVTGGLLSVVAAFGLVKVAVEAAQRKQPVAVVLLCVPVVAASALALWKKPDRTRRGDRVLAALREQHAALAESARTRWESLSDQEIILAVALFGPSAVTAGPVGRLRTALYAAPDATEESLPPPPPSDPE
jgi:uncharacterized protein (TIGR04222 family)